LISVVSRIATTRSVRRPSGIVSPARQFGTAVSNLAGSAVLPCAVSSLNRGPYAQVSREEYEDLVEQLRQESSVQLR
jgi:hypothetical protein